MTSEATAIFRELARKPELSSARFTSVTDNFISVESDWSQRCIEKFQESIFTRTHILSRDGLEKVTVSSPSLKAESIWSVSSPSGQKTAIVTKHIPDKKNPSVEHWMFEIWSSAGFCEKVINVSESEKHGVVYGDDGAFGSLCWNAAENQLIYVAEKKRPKTITFFEKTKKNSDTEVIPGDKFLHRDDWGEMLVAKEHPVVCILDIDSGEVTALEQDLHDYSCGQAVWCPDGKGIVFCAFSHKPFRLGITHCPIRRSVLYHYDLDTRVMKVLRDGDNCSVRMPRFSPDGKRMIYFECTSGGPHCKCLQMKMIEWESGVHKVVIDVVTNPADDDEFQGIYSPCLARQCWSSDSSHVFFSSAVRSTKHVYAVSISTGNVRKLTTTAGSWGIKDVQGDFVLVCFSRVDRPPRLAVGSIKELNGCGTVRWVFLDPEDVITGIKWETCQHTPLIPHPKYSNLTYESIVVQPTEGKSRGFIVFPHGGPHSSFTSGYQIYFAALAKLGFTLALVNFRGSTGFGQDSIDSLLGHVGDSDIKDVHQAAEDVIKMYKLNGEKVVALGGSHGGFITAHLIGQYPEFYKAAVMRNPVTNLVAKIALSDIPDWGHIEAGIDSYTPGTVPTDQVYSRLYSMSPVAHIEKVKAPTMIMLGKEDRRVPPCQGIEFHKSLISRGIKSRLHIYPDNSHPICSVEADSDSFVNLSSWFIQHLSTIE